MSRNSDPVKVGLPEDLEKRIRDEAQRRGLKLAQVLREIIFMHYDYNPNGRRRS